jgi:hypothetical protein
MSMPANAIAKPAMVEMSAAAMSAIQGASPNLAGVQAPVSNH